MTRLFDKLYEDSLSGRISNDNFTRLIDKYQTEQEQLLGQIQSLENALQEVKDSQTNAVQWAALMADYVGIQELTAENLNLLVERIEVFDRAEADGKVEQVIRICYRFGGYIGERRFKAKVLRNTGGWERHRRVTYINLLTSGRLNAYLADIDKQAQERFERLIEGMKQARGITERLKAENALEWVGKMNNIRACAMEIVNTEIIYA